MKLSVLIYGTIEMCIAASLFGMQPAPKSIAPVHVLTTCPVCPTHISSTLIANGWQAPMIPLPIKPTVTKLSTIAPLPAEKKTYLAKDIIHALELGSCYRCYANDDITLAEVDERPQGNCCCNYQRYKTSSIRYPCCSDHASKLFDQGSCKLTPGAEFTPCSCCGLCCLDSHGRCMFITCGRKDLSEANYAKQSFNTFCCFSALASIGTIPAMCYCCPESLMFCCKPIGYCCECCDECNCGEHCRNCMISFCNCCDACCKDYQTPSTQSSPSMPFGAIYSCCCL